MCHVTEDLQKNMEVDMETIQGYLPKGYALTPHIVRLIKNDDVGGRYSYDEEQKVWSVRFPDTPLGLRTAARLYCGVIQKGHMPSNDALRKAVLGHFEVKSLYDLPKEIWDNAIF